MKPQWETIPGGWKSAFQMLSEAWEDPKYLRGQWEIRIGYERTMARLEMRRVKAKRATVGKSAPVEIVEAKRRRA